MGGSIAKAVTPTYKARCGCACVVRGGWRLQFQAIRATTFSYEREKKVSFTTKSALSRHGMAEPVFFSSSLLLHESLWLSFPSRILFYGVGSCKHGLDISFVGD